jgi:hypothetical protein
VTVYTGSGPFLQQHPTVDRADSDLARAQQRSRNKTARQEIMRQLILLFLGMVLVVSGFHATLLLKSSNRNYCSSRGRNSDGRALDLNMAMDRHESIQFQEMARRLEDLKTEITTVSGEVQTLAGNRAIILASQALLIHISVQPKINVKPSNYSKALHNIINPDFFLILENVFRAADYQSKLVLTAKFDQMIDSRKLGAHAAHPSDLGLLNAEAAKLVEILQRRVASGITLDTDEETALLVLEKYAEPANAVNRDKRV